MNWIEEFYELNPDAIQYVGKQKKEKKETTLKLEDELRAMDFGDKKFYDKLTPEQKKEFSAWILMRFMSSSQNNSEHHILMVNDVVNAGFNSITKHPELQWLLLSVCGTKKKQFHPWIAPPKGIKKNKLEEALLKINPLLSQRDVLLLQKINTTDEFADYFKSYGYDDDVIDVILDRKQK